MTAPIRVTPEYELWRVIETSNVLNVPKRWVRWAGRPATAAEIEWAEWMVQASAAARAMGYR